MNNLERYKKDLDKLISEGETLRKAMIYQSNREYIKEYCKKNQINYDEMTKGLPDFSDYYQDWYTEYKYTINA